MVIFATVRELFLGPCAANYFEAFPETLPCRLHLDMKAGKLVRLIAAAGAKANPPMAEQVEFCQILSQTNRVVERQNVYASAEAEFACALGNRGQHHLR